MFFKSKKETPVDPFELDWGEITPDGYNQNEKSSLCVFAHSLISEEARPLSSIFAAGRIVWYNNHLPEGTANKVLLDIRGQDAMKYEFEIQENWAKELRSRTIDVHSNMILEIECLF